MGGLSEEQLQSIRNYLDEQGITYSPLKEELLDHLLSDLEGRIGQGEDFESAWHEMTGEIAQNHLKTIELETMKQLNKRLNLTNIFAGLSLAILGFAAFFKVLHLPGAGVLMVMFLVITSLILLISTAINVNQHREKQGRLFLSLMSIALVLFIAHLTFKIMHYPGANVLAGVSVSMIGILFPALSIYFYRSTGSLQNHVILNLLNRNGRTLEIIAGVMVGFGLLLNLSSWLTGQNQLIGVIFFILTIVWTGFYAYSFTWQVFLNKDRLNGIKRTALLFLSTAALILLMIPVFAGIPAALRTAATFLAPTIYIGIMMYYYMYYSISKYRFLMASLCGIFLLYPLLMLTARTGTMELSQTLLVSSTFNLSWLAFLLLALFAFHKDRFFRVLVIFMIAMHMIPTF